MTPSPLPPAPWATDFPTNIMGEVVSIAIIDANGFTVAHVEATGILNDYADKGFAHWADAPGVSHIDRSEEQVCATANLFLAAPDLLERLEWAIARLDECGKQVPFSLGVVRSLNDCRAVVERAKNGPA